MSIKQRTEVLELAEALLQEIQIKSETLKELQAEMEEEYRMVRMGHAIGITQLKSDVGELDKDLIKLMRGNKKSLFEETDTVKLDDGILLYGKNKKVSLPRDALKKALKAGYDEAVKISKSLDRAVIEKWPDERLFMIGGKRQLVEKFSYEVK